MTDLERWLIQQPPKPINPEITRLNREISEQRARIAAKFDREWDRLYWHARLAIGLMVVLIAARIFLLIIS